MASTKLNRTFGSGGNRLKWTWSGWIKRSGLSSNQCIFSAYENATNFTICSFESDDQLRFGDESSGNTNGRIISNAKYRDTNSWYHMVFVFDKNNATSGDKIKMYVNGERVTSFSDTGNVPSDTGQMNNSSLGRPHEIGCVNNSDFFNGYMSHIHFCDGYAYLPSDFGETDSTTGEWKIKASPNVSYGTTGYWILKDGNSVTDSSPNSNAWTVAGGTLTKSEGNPSNIFATLNPLDNFYSNHGLTNGNTRTSSSTSTSYQSPIFTTLGAASGKYYAECKVIQTSTAYSKIGIGATQITGTNQAFGSLSNQYVYNGETGAITGQSNGATYTDGDIVGIALDLDNNKLYFHKNGTYQNSGVPTSGSTGTGASSITAASSTGLGFYFLGCGDIASNSPQAIWEWNFGNGYFGTTAVSSAGTNASGNGIFEYDVPTGYTALSTKGLNE